MDLDEWDALVCAAETCEATWTEYATPGDEHLDEAVRIVEVSSKTWLIEQIKFR